jgi:hypothetical protein
MEARPERAIRLAKARRMVVFPLGNVFSSVTKLYGEREVVG